MIHVAKISHITCFPPIRLHWFLGRLLPQGRAVVVAGPPSSGKTHTTKEALARLHGWHVIEARLSTGKDTPQHG